MKLFDELWMQCKSNDLWHMNCMWKNHPPKFALFEIILMVTLPERIFCLWEVPLLKKNNLKFNNNIKVVEMAKDAALIKSYNLDI